jgi:YcaO-like protein with predicted kinase domain
MLAEASYLNLGGTIRGQSAASTLEWVKPFFENFGITRVANITGLDLIEIPVAVSIRPNSKHLTVAQGKGLTWELAMISAVMESIEGYHAENPNPPKIYGAYCKLKDNYPVISPRLFAKGLFAIPDIEAWPMAWAEALELNSGQRVLIPHVLSYLNTTLPHSEYSFLSVSSNGLAAGNTIEEAICHAIYEVIERDALCRWSQLTATTRAATQLQLETLNCTVNQQLLAKFYAAKQLIKVWDITSSLGIPSFHCVIQDTHAIRSLGMFRGTGTHMDKRIALARALTEAAQSRLTLISGSRDDVFADFYRQKMMFSYSSQELQGAKTFSDCKQPEIAASFAENIDYVLKQLSSLGYNQVFVINHTKAEFNIPVVHVFIPGMQYNGARI